MTVDIFILDVEPPLAPDAVASKSRKIDFDATASGANGGSTSKMNMSTVISTLDNPKSRSFNLNK
ncbi:hypothetical protein PFISCL1PPCAC_14533 [Pristionchus fissidentatus]|uniref:Uncharacterized protein n=1 Tax=Pristionchus fissidentatus TaxID=1538716 RepID=A0AAV5VU45_9BILA|nr:hypothetical protein PFISCL1PPCAC_14533 [Pristionchus fissidentatus]